MAAGVDPIGQTEEQSAHETTNSKVEISKVRVLMLLIVLVVSTIEGVPVSVDVLERLILF
tara:strand:- start:415 stop:594 length:180 start_codon:yes stop_codon:yes gene_type:complete